MIGRSRAVRARQPGTSRCDVTVVIATRDRVSDLCRTLDQLATLPERPPIIVVDNASGDGTADVVRDQYPGVDVFALRSNLGVYARNLGVRCASTRYVAFCDDDSWWEPGSLAEAVKILDKHGDVGLVTGQTLGGTGRVPDPINAVLAASPLPAGELPGPRVLGFLACAAVVRRTAFLEVGGFSALLSIGAEEELLALDLAAAGWPSVYIDSVVARHFPSAARDADGRRRLLARNEVLIRWMRRPPAIAVAATARLAVSAASDLGAVAGLASLLWLLPRAWAERKPLPADVEADLASLAG